MSEVSNYVVVTRGLRKNMQAVYELTLFCFFLGVENRRTGPSATSVTPFRSSLFALSVVSK